jgi:programmed cell death protein 5
MIGKPEKGRMVENLILQMAQTRQIMTKLSEEELIGLLEKVNQQFDSKHKTTVKVSYNFYVLTLLSTENVFVGS